MRVALDAVIYSEGVLMRTLETTATASREVLWNVSSTANQVAMYLVFALAMVVCLWGFWRRLALWGAGQPDDSRLSSPMLRFDRFWQNVLLQRKVNRERGPGVFHSLILWGFLTLLFTTTVVFIDNDLGIDIYHGRFYLGITLLSDLFGLALMVGVGLAFHRRYIERPDRLHSTPSDLWMLGLLWLMAAQGFLLEGLRIHATNDPWALYSPVGYAVAQFYWGLSEEGARAVHFLIWWFHAITVFGWIALFPYSKFLHIISSSANLFFMRLDRPKGALTYPGDIEQILEKAAESEDGAFSVGVNTLSDLTWKQRLDLDACTACGRCQDVCPAYNSGKALSPKWLILDTRNHMLGLQANGTLPSSGAQSNPLNRLDGSLLQSMVVGREPTGGEGRAKNPLVQNSARRVGLSLEDPLAGGVMDEDVFWSCTTCRACMEVCPVGIEHVDLIMDVRRSQALMEGNIPAEAQSSLRAIETRGNPFGPADSRIAWAEGLEVPILGAGDEVEILYWVGCISAYDKRKQKIARSMVQILNASGLKWGILGNKESCTGDPARRLGEENLFQNSAKKNIELLKSIRFTTVVANCPHCFNTLKNEYPDVGSFAEGRELRVVHHSHLIQELIANGRLALQRSLEEDITYHDPCYLGRYNDTYEEPREVLVQLGKKTKEMEKSREVGMCCGAGGGHFWMDMKVGERVNVQRVEQVAATGTSTVATACPFCMQMLEDGAKLTDREATLKVRDIAELVAEAL